MLRGAVQQMLRAQRAGAQSRLPPRFFSIVSIPTTPQSHTRRRVPLTGAQDLFPSSLLMHTHRVPFSTMPTRSSRVSLHMSVLPGSSIRSFSSRRNPWQSNDVVEKVKTGALMALGAGVVIASTSVAFGLVIAGAAGYGMYTLYQRFLGPFRSHSWPGREREPRGMGSIHDDIERIRDMFSSSQSRQTKRKMEDDLDALVQGMPLVVRGVMKTIFSFVGSMMKDSMARAGELRRLAIEHMNDHPRVRSELGDFDVTTPQQWEESTVNGRGSVRTVFPVTSRRGLVGQVTARATFQANGELRLDELTYRSLQTREVINLLQSASRGGKRTVLDAEYVDLADRTSDRH